jgi:hypothetical protein
MVLFFFNSDIINCLEMDVVVQVVVLLTGSLSKWRKWLMDPSSEHISIKNEDTIHQNWYDVHSEQGGSNEQSNQVGLCSHRLNLQKSLVELSDFHFFHMDRFIKMTVSKPYLFSKSSHLLLLRSPNPDFNLIISTLTELLNILDSNWINVLISFILHILNSGLVKLHINFLFARLNLNWLDLFELEVRFSFFYLRIFVEDGHLDVAHR